MILEVAILDVKERLQDEFNIAFPKAETIISSMEVYKLHQEFIRLGKELIYR